MGRCDMDSTMLDRTKQMLDILGDDQLRAINTVAAAFITDSPFRPKGEEELMKLIDQSVAHIAPEDCRDVDEFCDELIAEYGS